jgi:hypothetical protein
MNSTDQLYSKVKEIAQGVTSDLKIKGLVVPTRLPSGAIKFGGYSIIKKNGLYSITTNSDIKIIERINLPQTAILVANSLALGKWIDDKLINTDQQYGFCSFEEDQYKHISETAAKQKDWDKFDILAVKQSRAHIKAENAKKSIVISFEKLRRIR